MKFIHTADWHLGRQFHNVSLIEDQRHALEQMVALARDVEADAFVIAGDVYDRAVPNPEAVTLLDGFLGELVRGLEVPVIMIAGNHDSASRLGFGAELLRPSGLHIFGPVVSKPGVATLEDAAGPVHFVGLPYAEPAVTREATGEADIHNHEQAMAWLTRAARSQAPAGERTVCVAHCFVAGGEESESERPLSVGGASAVPKSVFEGFTYTALGHLHRPQRLGDRVHYSGSLLKYSFSEIPHVKSVNVVEIDGAGDVEVTAHRFSPLRDLRLIEGELAELVKGPAPGDNRDDLLLVRLTDRKALLDPMGRLRAVYPNVLHIERPALEQARPTALAGGDATLGDRELFAAFFEEVTGEALAAEQEKTFLEVYEHLQRREREADA